MLRYCYKRIFKLFTVDTKNLVYSLIFVSALFCCCEFLVYYIIEFKCNWPKIQSKNNEDPVNAMILADIHMLGPRQGHWFDKLRREWQMHRSFQTAINLFNPEVVLILGDVFDEGQWVNDKEYRDYVTRFYKLFNVPESTKLIAVVGNHDIGFHYRMHPYYTERFAETFNNTGVLLHTIKDVHFITINSMAMENDNCYFCAIAIKDLEKISKQLNCAKKPSECTINDKLEIKYSRPIILQHFPMYRPSDKGCIESDIPVLEKYREKWEVLSKDATKLIGKLLNPRLAFSGHSHHFCKLKNYLGIEEYTVASFNWRNKNNPSFLLAKFTPTEYSVSVCKLPEEKIVISIYFIGTLFLFSCKWYFDSIKKFSFLEIFLSIFVSCLLFV